MKMIKLTPLEAGFLLDTLYDLRHNSVYNDDDYLNAVELLEKAIEYAEDEEIPDGKTCEVSGRKDPVRFVDK